MISRPDTSAKDWARSRIRSIPCSAAAGSRLTTAIVAGGLGLAGTDAWLALLQANPNAFYKDNINALKRGAILRIPSHDDVKAAQLERVTVDTLDRVASELKLDRIDFVKIDVEGAEASVVAGARSVLATMRPVMPQCFAISSMTSTASRSLAPWPP